MESETRARIVAAFLGRAGEGADAGRIAALVVAAWQEVDAAMQPVIGQRGVAALYQRSLHLAAADHPWLKRRGDVLAPMGLAELQASLEGRSGADAAAAGAALLQIFHDLLSRLVGPSLTGRLLRSVWPISSADPPVQDS